MRELLVTTLFACLVTASSFAATFEGHLMPSKCRKENPQDHTRACAIACKDTGFGLLTSEGEFLSFDPAGNSKAVEALTASSRKADLKSRVEGTRKGSVITVESITLLDDEVAAAGGSSESISTAKAIAPSSLPSTPSVAILLFNGVQTIDYTAPYEVLADTLVQGSETLRVFTVAKKKGTIRTVAGMVVTPDYTFDNAPKADIVVIPGGTVMPIVEDPAVIEWVKSATTQASIVLTVCNGSFFLAKAGLLDGLEVTTTAGNLRILQAMAPRARVTGRKRVTDNGKIITAGGLAAGIDGALHVVQRVAGEQMARGLALYLEYNWQPEGTFLPGAMAFRHLTPLLLSTLVPMGAEIISSEGDGKQWVMNARIEAATSAGEVAAGLQQAASALPGWTSAGKSGTTNGCFAFHDYDDSAWKSCFDVQKSEAGVLSVTLRAEAGKSRGERSGR